MHLINFIAVRLRQLPFSYANTAASLSLWKASFFPLHDSPQTVQAAAIGTSSQTIINSAARCTDQPPENQWPCK